MSIDQQRVREAIERLHEELAGADEIDSATREQLSSALADIQRALQAKSSGKKVAADSESLVERLAAAARSFEDSHPTLSATIGSLLDTLGRAGI